MWSSEKQARFDLLRLREAQGGLPSAEREELDALCAELEAEGDRLLEPALERKRQEETRLRTEVSRRRADVAELERIAREQRRLVAEAHAFLQQIRARRAVLVEDYRRLTEGVPAMSR